MKKTSSLLFLFLLSLFVIAGCSQKHHAEHPTASPGTKKVVNEDGVGCGCSENNSCFCEKSCVCIGVPDENGVLYCDC